MESHRAKTARAARQLSTSRARPPMVPARCRPATPGGGMPRRGHPAELSLLRIPAVATHHTVERLDQMRLALGRPGLPRGAVASGFTQMSQLPAEIGVEI